LNYRQVNQADKRLIRSSLREISESDWNEFHDQISKCEFWSLGADGTTTFDGIDWSMEGCQWSHSEKKKYWVVNRTSPGNTAFGDACVSLISLYDKNILKEYFKEAR
jgi:hypothetical protein